MIFDVDLEKGIRRAIIEGEPSKNGTKKEKPRDIKVAEAAIRAVVPQVTGPQLAGLKAGEAVPEDLAEVMFKGLNLLAHSVDRTDSATPLPVYGPESTAADLVVLHHHAKGVVFAKEQAEAQRAEALLGRE